MHSLVSNNESVRFSSIDPTTPHMLVFAAAVFLLIITPGPGVMSTAGVGAAFGAAAGYRYVIGLCIGTNLVALAVVTGVAGAVLAQPGLRQILTGLSLIYIVWLALRVATVGAQIDFVSNDRAPGIRAALLLQALNPKAYVVNTTLFAGFAFDGQSWLMEQRAINIGMAIALLAVVALAIVRS